MIFPFLSTIFVLSAILFLSKNTSPWERYFEKTLYRDPSSVVVEAAKHFKGEGNAIDLGSGAGNDAAFLLNKGWQVWGIDGDPAADKWIKARKDLLSNNLTLITTKFEELDWNILPESDLIISINSLPFCDPESFPGVWLVLRKNLRLEDVLPGIFLEIDTAVSPIRKKAI